MKERKKKWTSHYLYNKKHKLHKCLCRQMKVTVLKYGKKIPKTIPMDMTIYLTSPIFLASVSYINNLHIFTMKTSASSSRTWKDRKYSLIQSKLVWQWFTQLLWLSLHSRHENSHTDLPQNFLYWPLITQWGHSEWMLMSMNSWKH